MPRCPDCKHPPKSHDMYGCVIIPCDCSLSGEFLLEFLEES